jgi:hypothetical protein
MLSHTTIRETKRELTKCHVLPLQFSKFKTTSHIQNWQGGEMGILSIVMNVYQAV